MKRKSLIFALSVTLLTAVCWLAFGARAHFAKPSLQPETNAAQTTVPPEVSYRQLFHIVSLLNQQAAEEEQQGRNGNAPRTLIRRLAGLSDAQGLTLTETANEYTQTLAEIETEARPLLEDYRNRKETAKTERQINPVAPAPQLRVLQSRLDKQQLRSRETLRANLGEEAFAKIEGFVQQNIADKIQLKQVSPKDSQPSAPPDRRARTPLNFTQTKPATLVNVEPNFGFCNFGFAAWLSVLWIDPVGASVFQYSATALDCCAGLHNDPYVFGELEKPWGTVVARSSRRGYASFLPAQILMATAAFPNTQYAAYSEHWYIRRPCGLAPNTPSFCDEYLDYLYFGGITPGCLSGPVSPDPEPNFIPPCPNPSPTPTPQPPTVKIESVGFSGDIPLTHWDKTVAKREKIDPNNDRPVWTRQRNPKYAAAYVRGTNPAIFATFSVTGPANVQTSYTVDIRVRRGNDIIATKNDEVFRSGTVPISGINVTALEPQPVAKRGEYEFTLEVSFDNGQTWRPAGKSGKHTIYWTYDTPLARPFRNKDDQECFQVADSPTQCGTIYDEALKVATEGLGGNGSNDLGVIAKKANEKVTSRNIYQPGPGGGEPANDHPLVMLDRQAQCSANANNLRGALRSIGIEADTDYIWGGDITSGKAIFYHFAVSSGTGVTFQVERPKSIEGLTNAVTVEKDPHFTFHAVVAVSGLSNYYDPSYGIVAENKVVKLLETSRHPDSNFFNGTAANSRKVIRNSLTTFDNLRQAADRMCPHGYSAGNLFPNPIDEASEFVTQQYLDFLGREPDTGGLEYWAGLITACGNNQQCVAERRILVSKEFFLSVEFQQTGAFIQRLYKAVYGHNPSFDEFLPETHSLAVGDNSPQALELRKQIYLDDWVQRSDFIENYYFTTSAEYVDALFANAGIAPTTQERADLINGLDNDTETLATVLRKVVDHPALISAEFNRSFVLMQYFGYLRRDPDQGGYDFWLSVLNETNNQNGMVSAFVDSAEYRARFGLP